MKKTVLAAVLAVAALGVTAPALAQSAKEFATYQRLQALDAYLQNTRQAQAETCTNTPTQAEYFNCLLRFGRSMTAGKQSMSTEIVNEVGKK